MMKDKLFLPAGVLGAVVVRLLYSLCCAKLLWHLAAGDALRLWGSARQM